jgi:hypothetical protein
MEVMADTAALCRSPDASLGWEAGARPGSKEVVGEELPGVWATTGSGDQSPLTTHGRSRVRAREGVRVGFGGRYR